MISSSFSAVVVCVCSEVKYFILLLVVLLYTLLVAEKLPLKVVLLSRYGSTSEMALSSWFYRPICKSRRFPDEKYALFIGPTTIKSLLRPFCDHKPLNCINDGPTKVERNEGATHIHMYIYSTHYTKTLEKREIIIMGRVPYIHKLKIKYIYIVVRSSTSYWLREF